MNVSQKFSTRLFVLLQIAALGLIFHHAASAAGEVDPTFNAALEDSTRGSARSVVVQPDGKILVAGNINVANNKSRNAVARFNADGTLDTSFDTPEISKLNTQGLYSTRDVTIYALALQADGKVLIGGDFMRVGDVARRGIVRLNADGSLDQTFFAPISSPSDPADSTVYDIKVIGSQIYIGGKFEIQVGGTFNYALSRLNPNGTVDSSFNASFSNAIVRAFAVQPDGKIIYSLATSISASTAALKRLNVDGSADVTFPDLVIYGGAVGIPPVLKIVLQPDGKILVGGMFFSISGFQQNNILRLNSNGNLDVNFNTNGSGANDLISDIAVLPGGKIFIGGRFTSYNGAARMKSALLNSDGTPDANVGYNPGTSAVVYAVASLGDGRVIIGGEDSTGTWSNKLARLNADGSLDSSFAAAIYQRGTATKVLAQPDGKVLVTGNFTKINGISRRSLVRLNQDGTIDTGFNVTFGNGGAVGSIALQPDGKILIGGAPFIVNGVTRYHLARLNADGSTDTSFQFLGNTLRPQTNIKHVFVLPDGKILVGGTINFGGTVSVMRLNADGSLDNSFTIVIASPDTVIYAMKVQPDGKFIIGGNFSSVNGVNRGRFARINADGSVDTTFNPPFGANGLVYDIAIQSTGNVIIGGDFSAVNGVNNHYYVARLFTDGSLDESFNPLPNATVYAMDRQADDKIVIGGLFNAVGGVPHSNLARINANGTLDTTFGGAGANDVVRSIAIQTDGKILIGGDFTRVNGISSVGIARLLNAPTAVRTLYDFDGDGKADVSVFRPSSGYWYELRSQNSGFYALQFGASTDLIAPADYDGDGKTDIAVWRGSVQGAGNFAYFYIYRSSDNSFLPVQFGATNDVPVSGDWDGDGKADLAVYRDGSLTGGQSYFFYRPTTAPAENYRTIAWGGTGDKPVYGDFDGDGKLDAAIFRASSGQWFILRSSDNQVINVAFGTSTDIPVPADYDGDGRANIAVFRPSNGTWYTSQNPATNYGAVLFGQSGDLPVPADYDGDGKTDVAVFRPSSGAWYQLRSTAGFTGVAFGDANDKPIPNAYIR